MELAVKSVVSARASCRPAQSSQYFIGNRVNPVHRLKTICVCFYDSDYIIWDENASLEIFEFKNVTWTTEEGEKLNL
jgi:hypothetical protein